MFVYVILLLLLLLTIWNCCHIFLSMSPRKSSCSLLTADRYKWPTKCINQTSFFCSLNLQSISNFQSNPILHWLTMSSFFCNQAVCFSLFSWLSFLYKNLWKMMKDHISFPKFKVMSSYIYYQNNKDNQFTVISNTIKQQILTIDELIILTTAFVFHL